MAGYFTGLCVAISTVQYFVRWGYLWSGAPARGGPVTAAWLAVLLDCCSGAARRFPGYRVHLTASEDLDPDRLRALARPEVVLWLTTRSNAAPGFDGGDGAAGERGPSSR